MHIACLQHVPFEGPATLVDWAGTRQHSFHTIRLFRDEPLYRASDADILIVLGGPMGVRDEDIYPWMKAEKRCIEDAIRNDKVVVGICLGAQLIADVLGATVTRNREPEIGWFPVLPAGSDLLRKPQTVLHWHGDTFNLPAGAELLAKSAACDNQIFTYNRKVLALQCHLECTPASVSTLVAHCAEELTPAPFVQDAARITSEPDTTYQGMNDLLFRWLDSLTTS